MIDGVVSRSDGDHYYLSCKEVSEAEYRAVYPAPSMDGPLGHGLGGNYSAGWPIHSEALAVHPEQIREATEDASRRGVPTSFDGLGRPIMTDSRHFRRYAKAYGMRHKGYV